MNYKYHIIIFNNLLLLLLFVYNVENTIVHIWLLWSDQTLLSIINSNIITFNIALSQVNYVLLMVNCTGRGSVKFSNKLHTLSNNLL